MKRAVKNMTVIEELLEALKAQQQTIEYLTAKLEETTAEESRQNKLNDANDQPIE
jgi:hypothetical protein